MNSPGNRVNAFLAAGHVCCVTGFESYPRLCEQYEIPIVVTGFEPLDLLEGIRRAVIQLENGEAKVENAYARVVSEHGNAAARDVINEVFDVVDRGWRGIGVIPSSGWRLSESYENFDAELKFAVSDIQTNESPLCRAGDVLKGAIKPNQCEAFGKQCTPRNPLGATMVSSEGACAAYYNYGRFIQLEAKTS
jgi:hydrogenase expression/formation protein HypD